MRNCILAFLAASLVGLTADSQSPFAVAVEEYAQRLHGEGRFMGTVLVMRGKETLFEKSWGFANAEWRQGFTAQTVFRLGSMSKHFAAVAALRLESEGKLSLTHPVLHYYPEGPPSWSRITLEHLLRHSSGLFNYTAAAGFHTRGGRRLEQILASMHPHPLEFRPGFGYSYSNTNYLLLGLILERITKMSYEQYLRQHVWGPARLTGLGYDWPETVIADRASGYVGNVKQLANAAFIDHREAHAAGALYGTARGTARWLDALEDGSILSQDNFARMIVPSLGDYGYGLTISTRRGQTYYEHGGAINGFSSFFLRSAQSGITIIVLSNLAGAPTGAMANEIFRLLP